MNKCCACCQKEKPELYECGLGVFCTDCSPFLLAFVRIVNAVFGRRP